MVELLVLFALSFAVVRYVEWSSAANQAEFMMRSERVDVRIAGPHSLQDIILERHALRDRSTAGCFRFLNQPRLGAGTAGNRPEAGGLLSQDQSTWEG
jgi:hypothetical protein